MVAYSDIKHLPSHEQHQVREAARAGRRIALKQAIASDQAERAEAALAEAMANRDAIQARGGIGTLTAQEYRRAKADMAKRLRRAK